MKTALKMLALAAAIIGIVALAGGMPGETSAAYDTQQITKALAAFKLDPQNSSPVVEHGTHLCSHPDHCGTGHLCCSGHCKAVSVC